MTDLYHVLLADPAGVEGPLLAPVIASFFNLAPFDAQQRARRTWGWLGERLSRGDADRLASLAEEKGVRVRVIAEGETVSLPKVQGPHAGGPTGTGLRFSVGAPAVEKQVSFGDIRLITFLGLREERETTVTTREGPSAGEKAAKLGILLATGIPLPIGKEQEVKKTVRSGEYFMCVDVITATDCYRVNPDRFGFSGLSGPATWSGLDNARGFITDVSARAPQALLNRGARWVLDKKPLNTLGYDERFSYEKECRWLLQLIPLRPS